MESIGLEKYIKPFLETKDFTVFGQGDEEALEIVHRLSEHFQYYLLD